MNAILTLLRRLVRWCFGVVESPQPDKPSEPPATVPFITPDALRRQIATATGIQCDCPKCRLRRQLASRYMPSNN